MSFASAPGAQGSGDDPQSAAPSYRSMDLTFAVSVLPFFLTFLIVATLSWKTLFPLLSGQTPAVRASHEPSFSLRKISLRACVLSPSRYPPVAHAWLRLFFNRLPAITFSTTIALSTVLAELIFCEISNILNPRARSIALEITISVLLVSLVIVTPALEIHSITSAAGWKFSGLKKGTRFFAWAIDVIGLIVWLVVFWWIGRAVLGNNHKHPEGLRIQGYRDQLIGSSGLSSGSLERIGIIGISLMASLAGFAAVSSLWQTFGAKTRKVTETDIMRKQAGLDATSDLLATKQSRLRALERKVIDAKPIVVNEGWMTRMMGSIRGSNDTQEIAALRMEISGLETMQTSLSNSVRLLRSRRAAQEQAATPSGRICLTASHIFSLYCLYRIAATSVATLRRWWGPTPKTQAESSQKGAFAGSSDPINNFLALLARHWDPNIDRAAWARQISFLLSGLMLLASFNAVLQTVLLFSRFTPSKLLHSAQQNLALLVSQISATYVVSSALLLRSNLPREMGGVIEGALGGRALEPRFVEGWFEGWFLGACGVTAAGIWVGRKVVGGGEWGFGDGDDGMDAEERDLERQIEKKF
ncbi:MAG: hypothetical protein M1831_007536 [Alyxoria varia]|nr:MAG: hypothetical protein M1831_007536 [Alyxoria varia]